MLLCTTYAPSPHMPFGLDVTNFGSEQVVASAGATAPTGTSRPTNAASRIRMRVLKGSSPLVATPRLPVGFVSWMSGVRRDGDRSPAVRAVVDTTSDWAHAGGRYARLVRSPRRYPQNGPCGRPRSDENVRWSTR